MSNDSMGNLEKLGILVIVILVVVVGVVAITPSDTLFPESNFARLDGPNGQLEPLPMTPPSAERDRERPATPPAGLPDVDPPISDTPAWPPESDDPPVLEPEVVANRPAPGRDPVAERPIEPEPIIEPARFREVKVRKNDSLWRIAEREYGPGKGTYYRAIATANPNVDPDRLREGQVLRVPVDPTATNRRATSPEPVVDPTPSTHAARTYTVQRGDTPMGISTKFYGTVRHFGLVLRHNDLADESELQAGMTIEIPPAPETSTNLPPADASTSAAPRGAAPAGGGRTYTVRKGDTLGRIAREQLGKESRWREILELNGLRDATELQADATIRLPR